MHQGTDARRRRTTSTCARPSSDDARRSPQIEKRQYGFIYPVTHPLPAHRKQSSPVSSSTSRCAARQLTLHTADASLSVSQLLQRAGLQALVEGEQVLDAFTFRREALPAVEAIDSAIQRLMRPSEVGRHQVRVVQVCQRRPRVGGASVEHGLR